MMASRAATTIQVRTRRTSQPSSRTAAVSSTIPMVAAMVRTGTRDRGSRMIVPSSRASLASAVIRPLPAGVVC
jgi:hypothetical protein